ncbi:hypothetical protein [Streptomyces scopuliridis]|uniref:Uncharacterized protein n=1 Tax=Streptomyces scopuliridis TaxID=452529 RepID=A0ACD4ZS12_9ACTN|nr:hypothetical protein [Streptomyces scopuliridis]WSC01226.1 hypothetical protein OG835_32345 [Streptomyces scopuliridis]
MNRLTAYLNDLFLRLYVRLQVFAAQEPVRLRAALTSAVLALAFVFPSISASVAERVGFVGAVALPILVGESARSRVTPTSDDK